MRKSLLALGVVAAVSAVPASAEYLYGFGGVYLDYQNGITNSHLTTVLARVLVTKQ
ncbi:hypothetical protein JCM19239_7893 [Vibrio variabilis]|uniref:Outer membrane protein A n=1 Tax=Vibrio variabilis TaxID=990271 RepID=A0ABQ0JLJ9_9VIBR|nr:hypothetical protein JCM19239_7893 [Vibrio variabilis]